MAAGGRGGLPRGLRLGPLGLACACWRGSRPGRRGAPGEGRPRAGLVDATSAMIWRSTAGNSRPAGDGSSCSTSTARSSTPRRASGCRCAPRGRARAARADRRPAPRDGRAAAAGRFRPRPRCPARRRPPRCCRLREHYGAGALLDVTVDDGVPAMLEELRARGVVRRRDDKPEVFALRVLEHTGLLRPSSPSTAPRSTAPSGTRTRWSPPRWPRIRTAASPAGRGPRARRARRCGHGLPCIGAGWGPCCPGELADAGAAVVAAPRRRGSGPSRGSSAPPPGRRSVVHDRCPRGARGSHDRDLVPPCPRPGVQPQSPRRRRRAARSWPGRRRDAAAASTASTATWSAWWTTTPSPAWRSTWVEGDAWPESVQPMAGGHPDPWPTPTWVGHMSSVAQRVLERLDGELSETDDGLAVVSGKVAVTVVVLAREDGAHKITAGSDAGASTRHRVQHPGPRAARTGMMKRWAVGLHASGGDPGGGRVHERDPRRRTPPTSRACSRNARNGEASGSWWPRSVPRGQPAGGGAGGGEGGGGGPADARRSAATASSARKHDGGAGHLGRAGQPDRADGDAGGDRRHAEARGSRRRRPPASNPAR